MSLFWRTWLTIWCLSVLLFGVVLAGGAFEATSAPVLKLLTLLQGGGEIALDKTLRFSLAVMGCVSIGWGATMLSIMQTAYRLGETAHLFWRGLTVGVAIWFVTDSALSAATGFALNIIPNSILMASYLVGVTASGALKGSNDPAKLSS